MITISTFLLTYLIMLEFPTSSWIQATGASSSPNSNYNDQSELPLTGNDNSTDNLNLNGSNPGELQIRYTGIIRSDITPEVAQALGLNQTYPGLIITEVLPDSPAERAGLRGANQVRAIQGEIVRLGGDIIIEVDGNRSAVVDRQAFIDYLQNEKRFGENITLTLLRDGSTRQANLTITPMPDYFWYINPDEGLRISYPSDWDISETRGRGDIVQFSSPEDDPDSEEAAATVLIKAIPSEGATIDELALREEEGTPDTRPLGVNSIELSGQQAYETIYFDYGQNNTMKVKSVFTITGDQIYIISFEADPSRYDDYLPMFEEMIKTFRFDTETE
jgi:hypothetical protein